MRIHLRCPTAELRHDGITLFLDHLSVHRRDGKVGSTHLLRQPIDLIDNDESLWRKHNMIITSLSPCIAEDDGLRDGERVV